MAKTIDTHTHTWGEDTDELPWSGGGLRESHTYSDRPYTHHHLIQDMEQMGVDESVVVSIGSIFYAQSRANEYMMRSIEAHPDRLWGVSEGTYYDADGSPLADDALREEIAQAVGHERILGTRMLASSPLNDYTNGVDPESDWILETELEAVYDELARRDKALHILCKYQQLSMVAELAERFPELDIVVDHLAWIDEGASADSGSWTDFERVAAHSNTYAKLSSLGMLSEDGWPYRDLYPFIRNLLDWFGSERLLFGTDYPQNDPWSTYQEVVTWPQEAEFLSARDLSWLQYRTFEALYN